MRKVPLGDVAQFIRGVTFKPENLVERTGNVIDCYRTKNVQQHLDTSDVLALPTGFPLKDAQILRSGDVLISTANSWNLVGKCVFVPHMQNKSTFGGFVTVLRAHEGLLEPRYMYWWLASGRVQATLRSLANKTTSISNLSLKRAATIEIPLPSLEDQRRIVDILDKADVLRAKRREAIAHLDSLGQSIFHEMFGDYRAGNPSTLRDATLTFVSGRNLVGSGSDAHAKNKVLKVNSASSGTFDGSQVKPLPREYDPPVEHKVNVGDLIVTRASGTKDLIGVATPVWNIQPDTYLPDKLWKAVMDPEVLIPEYFRFLTRSSSYREYVNNAASGAAGVSNISQKKLLAFPFHLPPGDTQSLFAERVSAIEKIKDKQMSQLMELDNLFQSLQDRAFKGEL